MRVLSYEDLADKGIKVNRSTIWRWIRAGRFPLPINIGQQNQWLEREIDELIERRIAERDGKTDSTA